MPKQPNPDTQPKCDHAHYHLTPQEHALWDISRAWSSKSGLLYFDGTKLAGQYRAWSRSQVYKLRDSLIELGWFQEVKKPRKNGNNWTAGTYHVLTHDEYVAKYGIGTCPEIGAHGIVKVPKKAKSSVHTEDTKPLRGIAVVSTVETRGVHVGDNGVHVGDNPCPPRGTKLVVSAFQAGKEAGKPAASFFPLFLIWMGLRTEPWSKTVLFLLVSTLKYPTRKLVYTGKYTTERSCGIWSNSAIPIRSPATLSTWMRSMSASRRTPSAGARSMTRQETESLWSKHKRRRRSW